MLEQRGQCLVRLCYILRRLGELDNVDDVALRLSRHEKPSRALECQVGMATRSVLCIASCRARVAGCESETAVSVVASKLHGDNRSGQQLAC